jgi:hypothetical protein
VLTADAGRNEDTRGGDARICSGISSVCRLGVATTGGKLRASIKRSLLVELELASFAKVCSYAPVFLAGTCTCCDCGGFGDRRRDGACISTCSLFSASLALFAGNLLAAPLCLALSRFFTFVFQFISSLGAHQGGMADSQLADAGQCGINCSLPEESCAAYVVLIEQSPMQRIT